LLPSLNVAFAVIIAGGFASEHCVQCDILRFDVNTIESPSVTMQSPVSVPSSFMGLFSPDTTPVEILSYGTYFRIPRNYLESILVSSDHTSVAFAADAKFPKFTGVTADLLDSDAIHAGDKVFLPGNDPSMVRMVTNNLILSPQHDPNEIVFDAEMGAQGCSVLDTLMAGRRFPRA
jgi:hypothetical protein